MANNIDLTICAPKPSFRRFRCSAWLIHDFAPSPMRALVFRSAYSASRNARASAAFAASIKAHCAVSSETLMLQVRFAHPPSAHRNLLSEGSGVPHGLFCDSAPSPIRALVFRSAYSASRNARASAAFAASIKAHCAVSSETLMLQPLRGLRTPHRSPVSSPLAATEGMPPPRRIHTSSYPFGVRSQRGSCRSPCTPSPPALQMQA